MHEDYQSAWHKRDEDRKTCWDDLDLSEKLPPLKHSETDTGFVFLRRVAAVRR